MTDREFWITVRRALLLVVHAIEERHDLRGGKAAADNRIAQPKTQ